MSEKITQLTEQAAGTLAADDVFVNVDVSDPTMAPSGTNKQSKWSSIITSMTSALNSVFATFAQGALADSALQPGSSLNASNLGSGTVPDARFPATLPAVSGVNLTSLNASNLGSGTVPDARFPAMLPAVSGVNLTALNASNLGSGTVPAARLPAPGTTTLGGVKRNANPGGQFVNGVDTDGSLLFSVPSGSGDVVGPASSVDGQVALFDLTTGKLLKASSASGVAKVTSGVLSASNVNLTSEVTGTLPVANGGTGITSLGTGVATFLGTPSSANLAAALTDETGSGAAVFGTSPTIVTPTVTGAITFQDDVRQTFNPGTTNAGFNVGSISGDPSTPTNGDIWYDSTANELTARINGSNVALGSGGGGGDAGSARFRVTKSTSQSITASTETTVTWDTEEYDNTNIFASNAATIPSGQAWLVGARLQHLNSNTSTTFTLRIKEGSTVLREVSLAIRSLNTSDDYSISWSGPLIGTGNAITVTLEQTGATRDIVGGNEYCEFWGVRQW